MSFGETGTIQRNGPGAAVHNFGTLRKAGGTGTATIDTDSAFDNVGTVEVNSRQAVREESRRAGQRHDTDGRHMEG